MSRPVPEISRKLLKLSETQLHFNLVAEDIRDRNVVDSNGDDVGVVDELFIDDVDHKVRFVQVKSGGFLGIGSSKFLLPIDAITGITGDTVQIGHTRQHVASAPIYNPDLVVDESIHQTLNHYGYRPFWDAGYVYPAYPHYTKEDGNI